MAAREKMTAEQATVFQGFSITNATQVAAAAVARGCDCKPYIDCFTYARWQALGYQVRKGEHGTKLGILIEQVKHNEDGSEYSEKRPWSTTVFCRHQVDKK